MRHRSLRRAGILAVILLAALLPVLGSGSARAACLPLFGGCLPFPGSPTPSAPVLTLPISPPAAASSPAATAPSLSGAARTGACGTPTPGSHRGHCAQASGRAIPQAMTPGQATVTGPSASQVSVSQIITLDPEAFPSGSDYSAANHTLYVASNDTSLQTLYEIDTTTNAVTRLVDPSFCFGAGVAVDSQMGLVYVANQCSPGNFDTNSVSVVSIAQNRVVQVIPISTAPLYPSHITIPSGLGKVFVGENTSPDSGPNADIVVIDRGGTHQILGRITSPAIQGIVGMASDATRVYATNNKDGDGIGNTLVQIDGQTDTVLNSLPVGTSPGVAVDAARNIDVALGVDYFPVGAVAVVNPFTFSLTRTIPVSSGSESGLSNLAVAGSSNPLFNIVGLFTTIYADDPGDGNLFVINPSAGTVQATVQLGSESCPAGITAISSHTVYVNLAQTGQVAVVQNLGGF